MHVGLGSSRFVRVVALPAAVVGGWNHTGLVVFDLTMLSARS